MLERESLRLVSADASAYGDWRHAVSARQTPRQNRLLAALPEQDYERLLPDLVPVRLPRGWTVYAAGATRTDLYFPTSGIVSRLRTLKDGVSTEFALAGSEGVVGVALFLGGDSTPIQAVVLSAGYAYRLRADRAKEEFERYGALTHLLLRYTLALTTQAGQSAVCHQYHSLEQRLCRWILSCLDRLPSNELAITQKVIADQLGVRREGVTAAAAGLQRTGLIRCSRGHITVLDRPQLEAQACECYAVVKREYARLLPENRQPQSL